MKKILVAYFSHSGNTRDIASQIQEMTGGDIFEIQTLKPYPDDYETFVKQAKQELDTGSKPALKTHIRTIRSYDPIFIGYPIWWRTLPPPVRTFLSEYDLSGKTIIPFCTHEANGLARSTFVIAKLCPDSTLLKGLAIQETETKTSQHEISRWLDKVGSQNRRIELVSK